MLDFAHVPPRGPEDVSLSEVGELTLQSRHYNDAAMEAYGHLALVQIINAFGEEAKMNIDDIKAIRERVHTLAKQLLGDSSTVVYTTVSGPTPRKNPWAASKSIRPFSKGLGTDWHLQEPGYRHDKLEPTLEGVAEARSKRASQGTTA